MGWGGKGKMKKKDRGSSLSSTLIFKRHEEVDLNLIETV